jgi:arsenate reductase
MMTSERVYNVLFLCTGNSARSILAEALMDHWGQGRFKGYSAGSFPKSEPHPLAIKLLSQFGMPTGHMRSKSWNEFAAPGAPQMDFVFTVCDQAAGEMCPIWPGHPITAHWGLPDPAAAQGSEAMRMLAFRECFAAFERRIKLFVEVRLEMDRQFVEDRAREIGRIGDEPGAGEAS